MRSPRWPSIVESVLLLAVGLGVGAWALFGEYTLLMHPRYRWLTIAGAALVVPMGLAVLFARPRRVPLSTVVAFGALIAVVLVARPFAAGAGAGLAPFAPGDGAPLPGREGYEERSLVEIARALQADDETADGENRYAMAGIVARPDFLEEDDDYVLLAPFMACCLADAIAYGFRVRGADEPPPAEGEWIVVYGAIEALAAARPVDPFRFGVLRWITVDPGHAIRSDGYVPFSATLPTLRDRLAGEQTSRFLAELEAAGLATVLEGDGPFTVFAPIDAAFSAAEAPPPVGLHVVPGRYTKRDLYEIDRLGTYDGNTLEVEVVNGKVRVGGARILFSDPGLRNGVLHLVHPRLRGP